MTRACEPNNEADNEPDNEPDNDARQKLADARVVVVKIGSRLLSESPAARPATLADDIARLRADRGVRFVLVSSGAIALGVRVLGLRARPRGLPELQAAAAIGQGRLMQHWEHAFAAHDIRIGQLLLTHDDIADRKRFLSARHTLRALMDMDCVPVINENDSVAVEEIKYGDNDRLAALVCNLIAADALLLCTDVDGLWDARGKRIPVVRDIVREAEPVARGSSADGVGSGGMASKVQAARAAARSGVPCVITPGRAPDVLTRVLSGQDIGTLFVPEAAPLSSRKHWIAYSSKPAGHIVVDHGATRALCERGKSLLPAGVLDAQGAFDLGDVVSLVTAEGREFARGLAGYRADDVVRLRGLQSADIAATLGYKYLDEVVHRDDLVLL